MLKALFLDLDLTLADTKLANQKGIQALANKINQQWNMNCGLEIAQAYVQAIYGSIPSHWQIKNKLDFKRYQFLQFCLQDKKKKIADIKIFKKLDTHFNKIRMANFDFYDGVADFLLKLRKRYKLIVITNGPSYSQRPKIKQLNLNNYVDKIIIGGEQKYEKPHKSIFQKAMNIYNLSAHECLHIGDNFETDIKGAINIKISAIWITKNNTFNKNKNIYILDKFLNINKILELKNLTLF